jgi:ketosteroid isomerase-like protein
MTPRNRQGGTVDTNAATIERFYEALSRGDYSTMGACYHPEVHFSDPVFEDLHGLEASAMWHMLCESGSDLNVTFDNVTGEGATGSAHWEARYTFSPTGRWVHNKIDAQFEFADGLITRHADTFDLWKWTRMALGTTGLLIGWTSSAKSKVRSAAQVRLARFIDDHPEYR